MFLILMDSYYNIEHFNINRKISIYISNDFHVLETNYR